MQGGQGSNVFAEAHFEDLIEVQSLDIGAITQVSREVQIDDNYELRGTAEEQLRP